MSTSWNQLAALFHELVNASSQQQQQRLREIANENAELAEELQVLLANADKTINFTSGVEAEQILSAERLAANSRLGRYRLVRELGQGGMGVVFLAHREEDFEQQVAIKLGQMTLAPEASAQFMRERQILADLSHPNIARLLDGGTTQTGAPFLVMEYVEGETIDDYCRIHKLGLIEVLRLFQKVCAGVSYAHQHLIIHRDIKPANIMVQSDGEPRLLDFGIAKIVAEDAAATLTVAHAMTPQYVSPEQLQGHQTTTLTDVYALGLLLYEMLTGQRAQNVNPGDLSSLHRIVIEGDPKPLIRVLMSEVASESAAGKQLQQKYGSWQRDLQNILQQALAKDPARRYPSVTALSADISRLLDGNPVEASGESLYYRLGKLAHKYRFQFVALSLAVASVVVLVIGLSWVTIIANQARDDAKRRLIQSEGLIGFMLGDLRQQLEPKVRLEILDSVGEKAMAYFASLDPADQSDEALAQTALSLRQIGEVRMSQGKFIEGEVAFQRSMEMTQSLYQRDPGNNQRLFDLGQSQFWIGYAMHSREDLVAAHLPFTRYLELSEELVAREPDNLDWLLELSYAHNNLGTLDQESGDLSAARNRFERSLDIKRQLVEREPDNKLWQFELADTLAWLADTEETLGRFEVALEYQHRRQAMIQALALVSPGDKQVEQMLGYASRDLARQLINLGQLADARELLEESIALADQRVIFDGENLQWLEDGARSRLDLVNLLTLSGDFQPAHRYLDEALALIKRLLAEAEPKDEWRWDLEARASYLEIMWYYFQSRWGEAQNWSSRALELQRALAVDHANNTFLRRLHQRSLLLAGDVEFALCNPEVAAGFWEQAFSPSIFTAAKDEAETSSYHPDDIALRTVVQARLSRTEEAKLTGAKLASMRYADPWYIQFSSSKTFENACNHDAETG